MTALAIPPMTDASIGADQRDSNTPDDLLAIEDDGLFELVDGRLTEKRMGWESNWIAGRIAFYLTAYLIQSRAGDLAPEPSFRCFPHDADRVRRPDVAVIAAGRLPRPWPRGHLTLRPDLAVEVLSPNDLAIEVEAKLDDYRLASVPLVWVAVSEFRLVRAYPLGGPVFAFRDGQTLTGDPILPGFEVAVADLFPPRGVNRMVGHWPSVSSVVRSIV